MLIHQSLAGAIIGSGGSKIKELRQKTGSDIHVYKMACPMSTDRVVQLNGTEETVVEAVKTVVDLIKDVPIMGNIQPYDPTFWDPRVANEYGGFAAPDGYGELKKQGVEGDG